MDFFFFFLPGLHQNQLQTRGVVSHMQCKTTSSGKMILHFEANGNQCTYMDMEANIGTHSRDRWTDLSGCVAPKSVGGGGPKVCQVCFHRYSCSIITADPRQRGCRGAMMERWAPSLWKQPRLRDFWEVMVHDFTEKLWPQNVRFLFLFLPKSYIWSKRNHFLHINAAQDPINIQQCFCFAVRAKRKMHTQHGVQYRLVSVFWKVIGRVVPTTTHWIQKLKNKKWTKTKLKWELPVSKEAFVFVL